MTALDTALRKAVHDYLSVHRISARRFGTEALRDPAFVGSLRNGRSVSLKTADRVLDFIGAPPIGASFRREVDAFLEITRVKPSFLGSETTGNPSFVTSLRRGLSPRLATVSRVRKWMADHATADETRAISRTVGAPPAITLQPGPSLTRKDAI